MDIKEILSVEICESAGVMPVSIDQERIILAAMNPEYEEVLKIKDRLKERYSIEVDMKQITSKEWENWFEEGHIYPQHSPLSTVAENKSPQNVNKQTSIDDLKKYNPEEQPNSRKSWFNPLNIKTTLSNQEVPVEKKFKEVNSAGSLGFQEDEGKYDFFDSDEDEEELDADIIYYDEIDDADDPVISAVGSILGTCARLKASDIHVEPLEERMRIRYRIDGVLSEIYSLPKTKSRAIVSRIKVMSKLDIAERRLPQDGRIRCNISDSILDFRVSTLPGKWGEKIVLRSLSSDSSILQLKKLVNLPSELSLVRALGNSPYGIFIVVGPTGSGKSTTLYSILNERNTPDVNISTVEDPVEYTLDGIHQVQVIREKGLDFARALRSLMRQDPDIILVGETRDKETAQTAMEAALTGHMVFTTLHANDTATAITRLSEMGIPPYLVGSSVVGVMAQRLVRKVCPACSTSRTVNQQQDQIAFNYGIKRLKVANTEQIKAKISDDNLCPTCNGTGYKGRLGLYEVMKVTEPIRELIVNSSTSEAIREYASQNGVKSLLEYGLELVKKELTTLEEVERVCIFEDSKDD